jgi:hypothetical protein
MAQTIPPSADMKPEIATRAGAPITNVGTGAATLPGPTISERKAGASLSSSMLPALAGGVVGSLLTGGTGGTGVLSQVANAVKNAISGGGGGGGTSTTPTGNLGSVQKFELSPGSTQADFDAKYGTTNGQSNVVVSGVDMTTGNVVGTINTNIQSSMTSLSPTQGGLSFGTSTAQQPTTTGGVYYQDDAGNIYDPNGNLYAVRAGDTYFVSTGSNVWMNADTGATYSGDQLFGVSSDATPSDAVYDPQTGEFVDYSSDLYYPYDPYSDYTPSEFTSYYTPTSYSGDLSPWGQGSSTDTSYYTPIDTSWGPSWKKGGLATPMYAEGGKVQSDGVHMAGGGLMDSILSYLTSGGVQGALAGALLSQLLEGTSSGGVNQGVDMSKVGVIQPRTTNFGMGVPQYVPYSAYGTPPPQTSAYDQLYSDLGVSGYTPKVSPLISFGQNPLAKAEGGSVAPYYTYGSIVRPEDNLAGGGQPLNTNVPMMEGAKQNYHVPVLAGRKDYRQGSYVEGAGDGQSDDIPAMLADGEYVIDSEVVSALGNGSNKAGAKVLDKMRENIRKHKRSGALNSIPPKAKSPLAYMKGAK